MNPQQIQHDLDWVVNCPSLLNASALLEQFGVDVLRFESNQVQVPASRRADLAGSLRSHRVGDYFEQLSLLAIEHLPNCEVLERQLQIHDNQRTIGEIDCIYRDEQAAIVHLEVAVKFFLFSEQLPSRSQSTESTPLAILNHWIGPNPADSLAGKLWHMLARQLRLGKQAKEVSQVSHSIDRRQLLLKGVLHYPRSQRLHLPSSSGIPHSLINDSHQQGTWIRFHELDDLSPGQDAESQVTYRIMQKPHWLSNHAPDAVWLDYPQFAEVVRECFHKGGSACLALLRHSGANSDFLGDERCFIVHDRWPEPA